MNIGQAAARSGLPVKTIRYYDQIGLISPDRGANGYRDFGPDQIRRLQFLAQARHLGFSLDECRRLMGLYCDDRRASRDVRDVATAHLAEIRARIAQLQGLEATLVAAIADCPGDDGPDCAILDRLSGADQAPVSPARTAASQAADKDFRV